MTSRRLKGEPDDVNREMWRLVTADHWEAVMQQVASGAWDSNRPLVMALQPGGLFLLSAAVSSAQVPAARRLIELGADVNARPPGEDRPLVVACESGSVEMVNLLLQAGAEVNAKCSATDDGDSGETALMVAATHGHRGIVEALLHDGACIDATTRRGRTAVSLVLDNGEIDLEMLRLLLDRGCPVDGRDLHYAVLQRNLEVFQWLLARKPDVNKPFDWPTYQGSPRKGDTPLLVAVDPTAAEMALDMPGSQANRAQRLAILDLLIEAGADVNAGRRTKTATTTPLMTARLFKDEEIATRLTRP